MSIDGTNTSGKVSLVDDKDLSLLVGLLDVDYGAGEFLGCAPEYEELNQLGVLVRLDESGESAAARYSFSEEALIKLHPYNPPRSWDTTKFKFDKLFNVFKSTFKDTVFDRTAFRKFVQARVDVSQDACYAMLMKLVKEGAVRMSGLDSKRHFQYQTSPAIYSQTTE